MSRLLMKVERLVVARCNEQAYIAKSNSCKTFFFKHNIKFFKKNKKTDDASKKAKTRAHKKFKHAKRDKNKLKRYKCGNKGHLAHEFIESKQVWSYSNNLFAYVSSRIMLTKSIPLWTINSIAIDHIARDRGTYVKFRQINSCTRWIYVRNNSKVEAKCIGMCKLELRRRNTLFLHDVLYALNIR